MAKDRLSRATGQPPGNSVVTKIISHEIDEVHKLAGVRHPTDSTRLVSTSKKAITNIETFRHSQTESSGKRLLCQFDSSRPSF